MKFFHGHLVVIATFLLNMAALGTYYSSAIFLLPLERAFPTASRAQIAYLPSVYLSLALFASLPAGWVQDWLQRRSMSIGPVFAVGGLCLGIGPIISSYGTTLGQVLIGAIFTGCGIGLTGFIAAGICVQWFDSNRGTMLLLAMAGSGCGNFLYSNGVHWLLHYLTELEGCDDLASGSGGVDGVSCNSWRYAMRIVGVVSSFIALASSSVMRMPRLGEVEEHEKGVVELVATYELDGNNDDVETDSMIESIYGSITTITTSGTAGAGIHQHHECMCFDDFEASANFTSPSDARSTWTFRQSLLRTHHHPSPALASSIAAEEGTPTMPIDQAAQRRKVVRDRRASMAEYEALSQLPINYRESIAETRAKIRSETDPSNIAAPEYSLDDVVQTKTTIGLLLWSLITSFAFTNFFVHLPAFANSVGLSSAVGSQALSLTGLFMLLGNLTLGGLTDRIGSIRTLQLTMTALVVSMILWPLCTAPSSLYMLAAAYGYFSTTQSSVPLVILADAFGEVAPESILILVGLQNVCKFPGYFLGPPMVGHLFESYGGTYGVAALATAAVMFLGNISLFALPSSEYQMQKLKEKL